MTNKERFIRCVLGQDIDRTPFIFYFGPWGTTVQKWAEEGVEGSLTAFYDDPEPVKTVMDDLTDFRLRIFELITRDVQVDMIHIWEDMSGKQGSLISPAFVREFMLPNYKRIRPLLGKPGYIPALDHLIPPEVSFVDYTYFVNRLRGMIHGEI